MSYLKYSINERIAFVHFNRPSAYNALNNETLVELDTLINELSTNNEIDVIIFTGEGKAFIAGADISEMANMDFEEARKYSEFGAKIFRKIEVLDKVTIAAVNGFCLGGGNELVLACDIRIASKKAKFGQPEVTLGITPGFSGTQRLPRIIGIAKAKELLFTGKIIDCEEAYNIGLVNQVVNEEELLENATALAKTIIKNSQNAVKLTKKAVNEGIEVPIDEAILLEMYYFSKCFNHFDQKEGMKAFLEKRPANFIK